MSVKPSDIFDGEGRVWFRGALEGSELVEFDRLCLLDKAPGARLAALHEFLKMLAPLDRLAGRLLPGARPVRVVAFNKSEASNWTLPWHQDRVIAVREKADVPGFFNWTRKSGVWHVEPPIDLLKRMMFARVHLDAATADNGCLELAPGSHAVGKIAEADIDAVAGASGPPEHCVAERGDILFVKALTLHRSRASQSAAERRALRIDYSADRLPPPLEWEFDV